MRRRLQLFLIRQWGRIRRQIIKTRESFRRPLQILSAFLAGPQVRSLQIVIIGTITIGTTGYMLIEDWPLFDAFYMTMITISTVGFGETRPLSPAGQIFTILVIILAITILAYGISSAVEYVVTGELLTNVEENERNMKLSQLQGHFIIAGYGRVGQEVAQALRQENIPAVVVEAREERIEKAQAAGYVVVEGNATEDDILLQAGIERARGVICSTGADTTNVYIVLTARGLNTDLLIISRASDENSEAKLLRAGADRVISPYILSGRRMANVAVRPFVVDFLDITGSAGELEKTLEEIVVESGSIIENRTIGEADLGQRTGALVLALYRSTGELLTNPRSETLLEAGTRMIVLGTRDALDIMEALAKNFLSLSEDRATKAPSPSETSATTNEPHKE